MGVLCDTGTDKPSEGRLSMWEGVGSMEKNQVTHRGWVLCILLYPLDAEVIAECLVLMLGVTHCLQFYFPTLLTLGSPGVSSLHYHPSYFILIQPPPMVLESPS